VRTLLGRLKEHLHQAYCQQDRLVLGEARRSKRGVITSAGMFVAVLFEEERRSWNREERNL
jgi:hypothetical protein